MNKTVLTLTLITFFGIFAIPVYQIEHVSGQTQEQAIPYVVQNTTNSMQDPLPGHESHQVVVAVPPGMTEGFIQA